MSAVNPYNTKQSFGKTSARCQKTLPISPHKKMIVVAGLASHVGLSLERKIE